MLLIALLAACMPPSAPTNPERDIRAESLLYQDAFDSAAAEDRLRRLWSVGTLDAYGRFGRVELAVTTNLSINFLRRPRPAAILADCRMIKVGRRLAYGEVFLFAEGAEEDGPVAHVTSTYSIPPDRDG